MVSEWEMHMTLGIVSGGSRGIGRAIALNLAAAGYDVVLTCHKNIEAAQQVVDEIEALGQKAASYAFDVASAEESASAMEQILAEHGTPEVLVHNAGITDDNLFLRMSQEAWERVIDTNLKSFYHLTKPLLRSMLKNRRGSIVCVTSLSGQKGNAGQVNYAAAKAGLIGACKSLALEVASRGIRVNAVAPGLIASDMTSGLDLDTLAKEIPLGRVGQPDDVAGAVRFLCSDEAAYITGQVIGVNGGLYT